MGEAYNFLVNSVSDSVIVACSGGPDSMALLSLVVKLKKETGIKVIVAHINHNVREESESEKDFVCDYCVRNDLIFEYMRIDKPTSKLDIKPTLMEICGIEDELSLGRSMFSSKDFACINNGRIITDKYFFDGDWYLIENGEKLNLENMQEEETEKLKYYEDCLQKELDISLSINILNLLKK